MAGLKELRGRIATVKSTEKITSAMKMVAASRLRRAQDVLQKNVTYRDSLYQAISRIIKRLRILEVEEKKTLKPHPLCVGKPENKRWLLVVLTSDKGLCGSYNSAIGKAATARIEQLKAEGKEVKIITLGYRGYNMLKRYYQDLIERQAESVVNRGVDYNEAKDLADELKAMFSGDQIDGCEIVYSKFKSALSREIVSEQVLPFDLQKIEVEVEDPKDGGYRVEPGDYVLLDELVPLAFSEFVFDILINSQASEQGARMTSMDNATRNAGDMIARLTLRYNRLRQGAITTELTEIIAGAEAV